MSKTANEKSSKPAPQNDLTTELLNKSFLNPEVFNKIKIMQQLPDDVVIKFLQAEFSLFETDYKKRISIEHK